MVINMRKIKVLLDFIKYSVSEKLVFYRHVISNLLDNPAFPNPYVSLADVKTDVDDFEAAILAAKDGGHTAVSALHDSEEVVDDDFRTLALYVDKMAAGDETKILSSGFHMSKQPVISTKPLLAIYDTEHPGTVKIVVKAQENAAAYILQYSKDVIPMTESEWIQAGISTYVTFELKGLTVGCTYYFRFASVTPQGTTEYCQPVAKIVV